MAGEHIFISATIARLSAANIATQLGSDKLPKDFDLVSPDEMNPHPNNRQARHPGWSVPHFVKVTSGPKSNKPNIGGKGCLWSGTGVKGSQGRSA